MYELLVGAVPYKGDSAVEIALKHLKEPLPSVRKANPSIPQSIENIIIKATAKNPKNRYSDAREMHEDIKTALDESRKDEKRYIYPYSENDLEETKVLDKELESLKKKEEVKEKEEVKKIEKETKEENKRQNKLLIVLISIFTALVLTVTVGLSIYFNKTEVKNVTIPDVSNKSIVEASNELTDLGFTVSTENKYSPSDTIAEGKIIKTSPEIGRKVKEGTTIILYVSSGEKNYVIEDVTGENYLVAKGKIEAECDCNVVIDYEKVDEDSKTKEEVVLRTEPEIGTSVALGTQITIFIPEIEYKYPNFTSGYSVAQVEEFCSKHEIKLEKKYQESTSVSEGTILKQSRASGSVVTPGATLTITIAIAPEEPVVSTVNDNDLDG